MPTLAELLATAEPLSPARFPNQAMELNQRSLQLEAANAAASVRLADAEQTQRKFAEATAACQEALCLSPTCPRRSAAPATHHREVGTCPGGSGGFHLG